MTHRLERLSEQARGGNKRDGDGNLRDDEHAVHRGAGRRRRAAGRWSTGDQPDDRPAGQHRACPHGEHDRKGSDWDVDRRRGQERNRRWQPARNFCHHHARDRDAADRACRGEQRCFDRQLANELADASTDCGAHRQFDPARFVGRDIQRREVRARNQQYCERGCSERQQRCARAPGKLLSQGFEARPMRIGRGGVRRPVQSIGCVARADARREARDHPVDVCAGAGIQIGCAGDWDPQLTGVGIERDSCGIDRPRRKHRRRHDAGDGVGLAAQPQRFADDVAARAKPLTPQGMRKDHHPRAAGLFVVGSERASDERTDAERLEIVRRHAHAADRHRAIGALDGESRGAKQRDGVETV